MIRIGVKILQLHNDSATPQLPNWGKNTNRILMEQNYLINNFAIMWQRRGEFLFYTISQSLPILAIL
jgi:hypothetical protein